MKTDVAEDEMLEEEEEENDGDEEELMAEALEKAVFAAD